MDFKNKEKLTEEIIVELDYNLVTKGYHVIENFYSNQECDSLQEILEKKISNYKTTEGSDRSKLDQFHLHDLICTDLLAAQMLEDPRTQQLVEPALGPNWILYAHTSSSLPPNGGTNYGSRIHADSPRHISGYPTNVGLIWALSDFTEENGATKVLPASHHSPITPNEQLFEKNCVQLLCKRGAVVIFNARVFHRAGINKSDQWRHSLTMNVCRPYMKQRMDWVRFVPSTIADKLNEQARRIIGYDTRLPISLEEFFVPEDKRLYKGGQE